MDPGECIAFGLSISCLLSSFPSRFFFCRPRAPAPRARAQLGCPAQHSTASAGNALQGDAADDAAWCGLANVPSSRGRWAQAQNTRITAIIFCLFLSPITLHHAMPTSTRVSFWERQG